MAGKSEGISVQNLDIVDTKVKAIMRPPPCCNLKEIFIVRSPKSAGCCKKICVGAVLL